ncbi:hypothetical protein PV325_011532 [Microctonus aethiopoides]|nr:hypothetical protein PV325_011532 [Microctonus aethiopoides]
MNIINVCSRQKCSFLEQKVYLHLKSIKNVTKKKLIIRKKSKPTVEKCDITSNLVENATATNNNKDCYNVNNIVNKTETLKNQIKHNNKFVFENLDDETLWNNDDEIFKFSNAPVSCGENTQNNKLNLNLKENQSLSSKAETSINSNEYTNKTSRFNELNMQMLSKKLHKQIFGESNNKQNLSSDKIMLLKRELEEFGMQVDDTVSVPDIDIDLPPLMGNNLEDHFLNISKAQAQPYLQIVERLIKFIPPMPEKWIFQEGWTRYANGKIEKVDYPLEDGIIFDVEVCVKEGPLPTLATAVTNEAWYGWVSNILVDGTSIPVESRSFTTDLLVPIESTSMEFGKKLNDHQKKPKIIVGHNVSYDRARIKEQYWLNSTGTRFIDTMSLHVCVSGMNSYQRALMLGQKSKPINQDWCNFTSMNNLVDVYKLYCDKKHEKSRRDVFVEGSLADIREQFDDLMNYCAVDVVVTHEILQKLIPLFNERFPHPVTFAGMLELSIAYLPVNTNWQRYIEASESTFSDLNYEVKCTLAKRADEVCKLMHNDKYKHDLWMWDQDWSTQSIKMKKMTKKQLTMIDEIMKAEVKELSDFEKYLTDGEDEPDPLEKEFSNLNATKYTLPVRSTHMPGYPAWYRKLCMKANDENWLPGPQNISTSMQVVPKLLNLTWENYPLHYIKEHGWGFLVPHSDSIDVETQLPLKELLAQCPLPNRNKSNVDTNIAMTTLEAEVQKDLHKTEFWRGKKYTKKNQPDTFYKGSGVWSNTDIDNCCWFFKLPHKDGSKLNVGNPLAKDFLNKFSENVLAGLDSSATEVLKIAQMMSYWRNNRDRIMSQMVVWLNENSLPSAVRQSLHRGNYGAIIPQVVVSGTLTRRATESTWMTASNAHHERVGSELRAMVQAPSGYNIVGADVDSQELWIASLIGDAYYAGIHGATPFGWMTLIGNKAKGTDMHSVTAKAVGISRDHAKVINYARIYGAGQKFAERLLKQFNPTMTESEASSKSKKMFSITKGKKMFRIKPEFITDDVDDRQYSGYEAQKISLAHGKSVEEMFGLGKWYGGSESAMFNRLEEIAGSQYPVTPFLNSRLSRALESEEDAGKYLPTKINWVVQSGAVDFLHLMLVSMRWLMRDNARFCLSFHDEIRYIVPSRYKYNAALAMHVTNLLTRSFCALRLGINDLPMSVAFFASVEVDAALRKDASADCKTPSNPHGLENEYGISAGESVDILKAIEKSGGSLGPWHSAQMKKKNQKLEQIVETKNDN